MVDDLQGKLKRMKCRLIFGSVRGSLADNNSRQWQHVQPKAFDVEHFRAGILLREIWEARHARDDIEAIAHAPEHRRIGAGHPKAPRRTSGLPDARVGEVLEPESEVFSCTSRSLNEGCAHTDHEIGNPEVLERTQKRAFSITQCGVI